MIILDPYVVSYFENCPVKSLQLHNNNMWNDLLCVQTVEPKEELITQCGDDVRLFTCFTLRSLKKAVKRISSDFTKHQNTKLELLQS